MVVMNLPTTFKSFKSISKVDITNFNQEETHTENKKHTLLDGWTPSYVGCWFLGLLGDYRCTEAR